ncbi:MAG: lactoylglutathione lyase [Ramlibacter sp.]|nr:lactoylglutathione lyase [Ramlibacter sp.]MBX3659872.1 lactoylglutathione lyase [Ramlibacter sp.]MCW5651062.1 lactoylglutathione lyase [Ramlibacter sp.]
MSKMIFVNLPVADLAKSTAFYKAVGAVLNPQFSDDTASCMVISETINVMLLTHAKWATFTKKPISDAHKASEVMLALSFDSRDAVNSTTDAAGKAGGVADCNPPKDYGFMFNRNFEDPDGHVWEAIWMDMSTPPSQ